ncbi:MerR-like DNA binding protein [Haloactinospora alba]|uniref:MerR-like DNA binding protein n=1 Tax=Haloactinospora alba TaxID=405555 RepID=A0A543NL72_9ACTN|nr:MerR family transcriptional regulator [Haloactinospora alba]TQN32562.1 MerR-like DNA binding protein [Haloactinospora alba]
MRISELSERSGVPVATIKYYLRENLLPRGEATSATQARYGEEHLRRLRLIRALVETAEVPLARIRTVLEAMDDPGTDLHHLLGATQYAFTPLAEAPPDEGAWEEAAATTTGLLAQLGWNVTPHSPARQQLTAAVATLAHLGHPVGAETLRVYASAARTAAERDIATVDPEASRAETAEHVVTMTALMEQALLGLHRLAQEDASARRFGSGEHSAE